MFSCFLSLLECGLHVSPGFLLELGTSFTFYFILFYFNLLLFFFSWKNQKKIGERRPKREDEIEIWIIRIIRKGIKKR